MILNISLSLYTIHILLFAKIEAKNTYQVFMQILGQNARYFDEPNKYKKQPQQNR